MIPRITLKFASAKIPNKILFKSNLKYLDNIRNFQLTSSLNVKMFNEYENKYAYNLMVEKGYAISLNSYNHNITSAVNGIDEIINRNWTNESASDIYNAFRTVTTYCSRNIIYISNRKFDNLIDCLTDNIKHLSDNELKELFYLLNSWPEPESVKTRNHIEVWAALDDECVRRIKNWSFDKMLEFVGLMYMLNIMKMSDYAYKSLQKLTSKYKQLTPDQLVQTLFYVGTLRKATVDMHNFEIYLENNISNFSIDELAIMSMGFFKSQTPIRNMRVISTIIDKIIDNKRTIHEISLTALLKLVRYSMKISADDQIYKLLTALMSEVPRLSIMCRVHISLLGTSTLTYHERCLNTVAESIIHNISQCRMKDLERLTLAFAMFNLIPQTSEPFFEKLQEELRKEERNAEIKSHGRSFTNCIAYLTLIGIYPEDLIHKALDPQFLELIYGKAIYSYGREILVLTNVVDIFHKHSNINRLKEKTVSVLAKKYTDYVPNEHYKKQFNVTEKMMLDVIQVLRKYRGEEYVKGDHILTHYQRGDIIICNDQNGTPVKVTNFNENSLFGPIRRVPDDNTWIVFIIAGRNSIVQNSNMLTGLFNAKIRQLQSLGYHPVPVMWNVWVTLKSCEEKYNYLNNLITVFNKISDK